MSYAGCHRPAQACDLDHVRDWGKDGFINDENFTAYKNAVLRRIATDPLAVVAAIIS